MQQSLTGNEPGRNPAEVFEWVSLWALAVNEKNAAGSNAQIKNAVEIGMEHNLGLTCDSIGELVQIPCIERNTIGVIKAINAAIWRRAATAVMSLASTPWSKRCARLARACARSTRKPASVGWRSTW